MTEVAPRVFEAPLLRGLDPAARRLLAAAATERQLAPGEILYLEGGDADAIYVVIEGVVTVEATRRGEEHARVLREAQASDTVGEEAVLELPRRATARARDGARVVEFPAALFRRGAGRSSESRSRDREARILARSATADLLRMTAVTKDLPPLEFDMVLDAVVLRRFERGSAIYREGERADDVFVVVDGLVQLQTEDEDVVRVQAYLSRGDVFGHEDRLGTERTHHAISMGQSRCLALPAAVYRTLADRIPGLDAQVSRVTSDRRQRQGAVVGAAAEHTTQHVFHDLYRMQMARSLLVIDPDRCVRCGHCAWSCAATHDDGVSRLVRRGDKVVTRLAVVGRPAASERRSLLIPNSCQHCKNPACMVDCPTGAIGRDIDGEVFIRPELCTGCGNCAKACPWENIHLAPRPAPLGGLSIDVAVKCDLCRGYDGPACVQACPTEAITRLDPGRDVAEVAELLGAEGPPTRSPDRWRGDPTVITAWMCAALAGVGLAGFRLQAEHLWQPGQGPGAVAGWVAVAGFVLAGAYVIPKRFVRLWHRKTARVAVARRRFEPAPQPPPPRSRLARWVSVHVVSGTAMAAAVAAHAGPRWPGGVASVLMVVFWAVVVTAVIGTLAYRWLPRRLGRLEREAALPEDLRGREAVLQERMFRQISGRSDVVKTIAKTMLQPYARSPIASLSLLLWGRSLGRERERLRARVERTLAGRGQGRLDGLDALILTVVELRALPVLRLGHVLLRAWLPVHVVLAALLVGAVGMHLFVVLGGP